MTIKCYRDLHVWQAAMDFAEAVYRMTEKLPKNEGYGLISQVQRAAVSIPSNIAEGHARSYDKEFYRYLSIALGSLAETETQINLAGRVGYLTDGDTAPLLAEADAIGKQLRNLQKAVKNSSQKPAASSQKWGYK